MARLGLAAWAAAALGCADAAPIDGSGDAGVGTGTDTGGPDSDGDTSGSAETGTGDSGSSGAASTDGGDGDGDNDGGDGDDGGSGGGDGDGDGDGLDCDGVDADTVSCRCFDGVYANGIPPGPDYDGLEAEALRDGNPDLTFRIGDHCAGTDNQDIFDIERVVFLGDSVTVGTPPTEVPDYYRSRLADDLAVLFGLEAPGGLWKTADPFNGSSVVQDSGDFSNCAEWGARTDDFLMGGDQIASCFPSEKRDLNTLVVMTMGGNDISRLAQDGIGSAPASPDELWADVEQFVQYKREAIEWLKDPLNLTGEVFVVFGNIYEYTDGTANLLSCPTASAAGFDENWMDPALLMEMAVYANEQYARIAYETGSDLVLMLEAFCGRGFLRDDPSTVCHRGPGEPAYFDLTCIHPTPEGHAALAQQFLDVIEE